MPPRLLTKSSIGLLSSSSTITGQELEKAPRVFSTRMEGFGASQQGEDALTVSTALGASQEHQVSASSGKAEPFAAPPLLQDTSVVTEKPNKIPTLQTRQFWDGTIVEAGTDSFVATLIDRTNPENPEER